MEFKFLNNSLVIVAHHHNPTVISDTFLINSGIIEKDEEIDRNNLIITPAVSQVNLKDGSRFVLEQNRLTLTSDPGKRIFEIGTKYCQHLPYINGTAIGINFEAETTAEDFDIEKWFSTILSINYNHTLINGIDFVFDVNTDSKCYVKVSKRENSKNAHIKFNFHHQLNKTPLKDINIDFVNKWENYSKNCQEFINKLFENKG